MSTVTYKQRQHNNETSKTTIINSVKFNTNIEINNKQNNSTDNFSIKGIDKEKSNKRTHISKYLAGNVRTNRSTTENKKINYNLTRPDERKNV